MQLTLERNEAGELCLFVDGVAAPAQSQVQVIQNPDQLTKVCVTFSCDARLGDEAVKIKGDF